MGLLTCLENDQTRLNKRSLLKLSKNMLNDIMRYTSSGKTTELPHDSAGTAIKFLEEKLGANAD